MFIDTSVVMYAAGAEHPQRASCQLVLRRVAGGDLDAVTSTEVLQEILHRFARSRRDTGQRMARGVLDLFGDLIPVDRRGGDLLRDLPSALCAGRVARRDLRCQRHH